MTKDGALRLALEALEDLRMKHYESTGELLYKETFNTIKKALEIKDEPVAWEQIHEHMAGPNYVAPQRTWVGLTDEEKAQFVVAYYPSNWDRKTAVSLMNDYEKYLKEKNNAI